jgi:hypothetical protein
MSPMKLHLTAALFLGLSFGCVWALLSILVAAFKGKAIAGDVNRNENPALYWFLVLAAGFALIPMSFILVLSLAHFVLRMFIA